ncbi:MAG: hypothetical protein MRZ79_12435, partial [Bacteroidia bacterium]|nr:hypothetical protein [Bacteroidia bacterium]
MTGIIIFTLLMMAIAGLSNSIMDTLRYRYEGSVFESLSQKRSPIGRFFKAWAGPQSHLNKFWLDEHPIWGPLFGWLFHGPLIFTTSLWHFSKFTMLSSLQIGSIGVLFLMEKLTFYQGLWYFFAMKFVFRFIFELFFPSYENDRRELWEARYRSMSRLAIPR